MWEATLNVEGEEAAVKKVLERVERLPKCSW